jgi:hypothetical protein
LAESLPRIVSRLPIKEAEMADKPKVPAAPAPVKVNKQALHKATAAKLKQLSSADSNYVDVDDVRCYFDPNTGLYSDCHPRD